jgi:hypothetical protein
MLEYSSRITPPNFCAGLAHYPPGLLEVKNLYCNVNIGMKNSKGFIQSNTSAIWPFRKIINATYYNNISMPLIALYISSHLTHYPSSTFILLQHLSSNILILFLIL